MEYLKLEVGMPGSIFELDHTLYGKLAEDSWVKQLWGFMREKGITVQDDIGTFALLREKDAPINVYLCNAFKMGIITANEWKRANLCRKYLRVLTIADLATGDGKFVAKSAMQGIRKIASTRNLPWFEQGKPNARDWRIWRSVLKQSLCFDDRKLWIPLGKWHYHAKTSVLNYWDWWWDKEKEQLLQRIGNNWRKYQISPNRQRCRNKPAFRYYTIVQQPTNWKDLELTTVRRDQGCIYIWKGTGPS